MKIYQLNGTRLLTPGTAYGRQGADPWDDPGVPALVEAMLGGYPVIPVAPSVITPAQLSPMNSVLPASGEITYTVALGQYSGTPTPNVTFQMEIGGQWEDSDYPVLIEGFVQPKFRVRVWNGVSPDVLEPFNPVVSLSPLTVTQPAPISITPDEEPLEYDVSARVNTIYGYTLSTGTLPDGVVLVDDTLVIDGLAIGSYSIPVTVSGEYGQSAVVTYSVTVAAIPALTAVLTPDPPIAGQSLNIAFSTAPDSVSVAIDGASVSGALVGSEWTSSSVLPMDSGGDSLTVLAEADGFTDLSLSVNVDPYVDPGLSVETVDGTAVISGSGDITWTITDPAEYAGTFTQDRAVEFSGPLNIGYTENTAPQYIVAPAIRRYSGPGTEDNNYVGTEYRRTVGLAQVKTGAAVTVTGEWYEGGVATGYTGLSYSRVGVEDVEYRETTTVAGQPARTAVSNAIIGEEVPGTETLFIAPNGTLIAAFSDPVGRSWGGAGLLSTQIQNNYLRGKSGNIVVHFVAPTNGPVRGAQRSIARVKMIPGSNVDGRSRTVLPAVMIDGNSASGTRRGYGLNLQNTGACRLTRIDPGSVATHLITTASGFTNAYAGMDTTWVLEIDGDGYLKTYINGVLIPALSPATPDTTYTSGIAGLATIGNFPEAEYAQDHGTYAFDEGAL